MNCQQVAYKIEAHLDGDLSAGESRELRAHVAACSRCSARFAALLRTVAALEALPELQAPEELRVEIAWAKTPPEVPLAPRPACNWARIAWTLGVLGAVSTAGIIAAIMWVAGHAAAWWNSPGGAGQMWVAHAVRIALLGGKVAGAAVAAGGKPLLLGLSLDIALLVVLLLILKAWRAKSVPSGLLVTL